ncbi:hypothetical protein OXB_1397 [Bacillus sp. OxB-1]|uniref:bifunctional adenosylcobinamide kinase/adenosylcobinamide-phosphate guanylyltransferase n=1 Tax=Bacillus sp. (strain OxB-1) TaxID=98228 RepID=UPI0005820573|nr:bifunctional adenosylcobinamide kinase/adenosylcobinamide-phosphate guanylyltransferase [Bacillus sp. OxB-1]BAQ09868.1 hypothetical protein OXB_1397 [Bacillus sp. OxB-1]
MHVYIGGAANGKRDYVRSMLAGREVSWYEGKLPERVDSTVVVAGLENWMAGTELSEAEAVRQALESLKGQEVIVILTDIGRGIVPMDPALRELRDRCGRLYQRLLAEADEVTRIWYGLAQTLKKRGEGT